MIHTDPPFFRKRKKKAEPFFPGVQREVERSRQRVDRSSQETDDLNAAGVGAEPRQDGTIQRILRAVMAGLGNVDQRQEGIAGAMGSIGAGYNSAMGTLDRRSNTEWEQGQKTARNAADIYNANQRNRLLGDELDMRRSRDEVNERNVESQIDYRSRLPADQIGRASCRERV